MVKLLVFLGNPGRIYQKTRHNIGWLFSEYSYPHLTWSQKFHSQIASYEGMRFLKPETFMNESGRAVRACTDFFSLKAEEILVVHDDLELEFGTIRLQKGGGLGGHNGLKSIKNHLRDDQFLRLRFGIGRPQRGSVASYVLLPFSQEEAPLLSLLFAQAETMLEEGFYSLPVTNTLVQ